MPNDQHNAPEQVRRILFARATERVIHEMNVDQQRAYAGLVSRQPPPSAQELGEKIKALVAPETLDRIWRQEQAALLREVMELSTKAT